MLIWLRNSFLLKVSQVCQQNLERNMSKSAVCTVQADGLAPLGARPSAGAVMKFGSCILMEPALKGLINAGT